MSTKERTRPGGFELFSGDFFFFFFFFLGRTDLYMKGKLLFFKILTCCLFFSVVN